MTTGKLYSFPWHNDQCQRSQEYLDKDGHKRFFCLTHHQWASEMPVSKTVTYTYGDGTTHAVTTQRNSQP